MPTEMDWLVPRPTTEQQFKLAAAQMEIREAAVVAPQLVEALALTLSEQVVQMEAIIRQVKHEIAMLKSPPAAYDAQRLEAGRQRWLEVARELCPGPV